MKKIVLVGGGGHCKSVLDTLKELNQFEVVGILDNKEKVGLNIMGVPFIGTDEDSIKVFESGVKYAFVTVGSIGNAELRKKLYRDLKSIGFILTPIVDKTAIISENTKIDEGTFIGKGSIINANSIIGKMCIVNTGVIIDHDCIVNDFVHIAPGSILCGGASIGEDSHIGTGTKIIQGISIGSNTLIGAGSLVVRDMGNNLVCFGSPCKKIKDK